MLNLVLLHSSKSSWMPCSICLFQVSSSFVHINSKRPSAFHMCAAHIKNYKRNSKNTDSKSHFQTVSKSMSLAIFFSWKKKLGISIRKIVQVVCIGKKTKDNFLFFSFNPFHVMVIGCLNKCHLSHTHLEFYYCQFSQRQIIVLNLFDRKIRTKWQSAKAFTKTIFNSVLSPFSIVLWLSRSIVLVFVFCKTNGRRRRRNQCVCGLFVLLWALAFQFPFFII